MPIVRKDSSCVESMRYKYSAPPKGCAIDDALDMDARESLAMKFGNETVRATSEGAVERNFNGCFIFQDF